MTKEPRSYRLCRGLENGSESVHENGPIVIPGKDIREVTVCNIAAEPCMRIEVPEGGMLIVELRAGRE